jgi:hypothetical protein
MTLWKREDTVNLKRKHWIPFCGEPALGDVTFYLPTFHERFCDVERGSRCEQRQNVALEEFMDLSQERLWNERVSE